MADINKITQGQTLYEVKRNTGRDAWNGPYSVWPVEVISVHPEEGYIIASWNTNPPRKMFGETVKKLRYKYPK